MNQTLKFSFRNLFLSCVCLLLFACGGNPEIISPDGRTRLSFVTGADAAWPIPSNATQAFDPPSALGLVAQERDLAGGFSVREIGEKVRGRKHGRSRGAKIKSCAIATTK